MSTKQEFREQNAERAERGEALIELWRHLMAEAPDKSNGQDAITDVLHALRARAGRKKFSGRAVVESALMNFDAEVEQARTGYEC